MGPMGNEIGFKEVNFQKNLAQWEDRGGHDL